MGVECDGGQLPPVILYAIDKCQGHAKMERLFVSARSLTLSSLSSRISVNLGRSFPSITITHCSVIDLGYRDRKFLLQVILQEKL